MNSAFPLLCCLYFQCKVKSLRYQTYGTQMKSGCLNLGLEVLLECVSRLQRVSASWGCVPAGREDPQPQAPLLWLLL